MLQKIHSSPQSGKCVKERCGRIWLQNMYQKQQTNKLSNATTKNFNVANNHIQQTIKYDKKQSNVTSKLLNATNKSNRKIPQPCKGSEWNNMCAEIEQHQNIEIQQYL